MFTNLPLHSTTIVFGQLDKTALWNVYALAYIYLSLCFGRKDLGMSIPKRILRPTPTHNRRATSTSYVRTQHLQRQRVFIKFHIYSRSRLRNRLSLPAILCWPKNLSGCVYSFPLLSIDTFVCVFMDRICLRPPQSAKSWRSFILPRAVSVQTGYNIVTNCFFFHWKPEEPSTMY